MVVLLLHVVCQLLDNSCPQACLCRVADLASVDLEVAEVPIAAVSEHPYLYALFDGLHWHVLLDGGTAGEFYHFLVNCNFFVRQVYRLEFLCKVVDKGTYFP